MAMRTHHRGWSRRVCRGVRLEPLEDRRLLAGGWQNEVLPCDVDASGLVTPLDALLVINDLNRYGGRKLPEVDSAHAPPPYLDVDGNGFASPLDVLHIVNAINNDPGTLALTANLSPASDPNGNGVVLSSEVRVVGQSRAGAIIRATAVDPAMDSTAAASAGVVSAVAGSDGRFELEIELPHATNVLRVEATDAVGRSVSTARVVRQGDVILDWNAALLNAVRDWTTTSNDPYTGRIVPSPPPAVARHLAMVHAAMFDAVNAIEPTHEAYVFAGSASGGSSFADASPVVAAATAAYHVASSLYSDADELAVWEASLSEALASVPEGLGRERGMALGEQAAAAVLAVRVADGSDAVWSYAPGTEPGAWNRTLPGYLPPLLPQWPQLTPFVIPSGDAFRPPAPPELASAEYAAAVDEVMRLGRLGSTERTADQTEIAIFWADGGGTFTPPGHWNQIAADVALGKGTTLAENARLMALLNLALADAGIAAWDAKYAYDLWRPIDAIRRADVDGNPATVADPGWLPLLVTPPFPTYTSGHSTFSGAADAVLTVFFGAETAFESTLDGHTAPGQRPLAPELIVTRSFSSFTQAAEEAGRSRIYGGIHFVFDDSAGLASGRAVGSYVAAEALQPRSHGGGGD
ncbi:dockerin type I domain-containing protein [Candidatus Laterigemmans baculatus]|uniref:dockerin type I domain-containing protein n=1 Tax=Candidatus Laterigemmans baculatus TaxID=2770505 RepID=UPI0013DD045A|nr:dockerin type I domain-containing protein [Candidatus Laterigemmans baculatus]